MQHFWKMFPASAGKLLLLSFPIQEGLQARRFCAFLLTGQSVLVVFLTLEDREKESWRGDGLL